MSVRHCVFVLGTAGSAKTELWKTLRRAQTYLNIGGGRSQYDSLNPKAVTSNDLYGYVHPVTKEPYDGIIAKIMRDFKNDAVRPNAPKWVILDGDIDAEWIESMNTVMDDNKVLTLVLQRAHPAHAVDAPHLRDLAPANASPATASRAGVRLPQRDRRRLAAVRASRGSRRWATRRTQGDGVLEQLFEQYVAPTLDNIR